MSQFDPYYEWLGVPPTEQPPNHYRLLGVPQGEENENVITNAYDRLMGFLKTKNLGPSRADAERLMNELTAARNVLLHPKKRAIYNQTLALEASLEVNEPATPTEPALNLATPAVRLTKPTKKGQQGLMIGIQVVGVIFGGLIAIPCAIGLFAMLGMDPFGLLEKTPSTPVAVVSEETKEIVVESIEPVQTKQQEPLVPPSRPSAATTPTAPVSQKLNAPPHLPRVVGPGQWVDLLEWAEGWDWKERGIDWNANLEEPPKKDGIKLVNKLFNRFPLPAIINGDYEMEIEFTRHEGNESIGCMFPVGNHVLQLELSGWGGSSGGVSWIDGKHYSERNPTLRQPSALTNGVRHRLVIRATRMGENAQFEIDLDDAKNYISWNGPYSSLYSKHGGGWNISMIAHPWLCAHRIRSTIHKVRVKMFNGEIRRDTITPAEREDDLKNGFVRLIGESAIEPKVGAYEFLVNQLPIAFGPGEFEREWPTEGINCNDFYSAHAPSTLKFRIPENAKGFSAVGYNYRSEGVLNIFEVYVDGVKFAEYGPGGLALLRCDIRANSKELELKIRPSSIGGDQCYWCYPRFHNVGAREITADMVDADPSSRQLPLELLSGEAPWGGVRRNATINNIAIKPSSYRSLRLCCEFLFAYASSSVKYDIPQGGFNRFTASGICTPNGRVRFEVWADGVRISQSADAGRESIDSKIPSGAKQLELRIVEQPSQKGFHRAVWLNPRLYTEVGYEARQAANLLEPTLIVKPNVESAQTPVVQDHVIGTSPKVEMPKQPAEPPPQPKTDESRSLADLLEPEKTSPKLVASPATSTAGRTLWKYDGGSFEKQADGSWKHTSKSSEKSYRYKELGSTPEYVELENLDAKGRVRLYLTGSQIDRTLSGEYTNHWVGSWSSATAGQPHVIASTNPSKSASGPAANNVDESGKLPVNQEIDLLAMVKLPDHAVLGNWKRVDNAIVCDTSQKFSRFMLPVAVRGSYQISIKFMRRTGNEGIGMIFPVGNSQCSIYVDANGGKVASLGAIDGKGHDASAKPPTGITKPEPFLNGISHELTVNVVHTGAKVSVQAELNRNKFVSWSDSLDHLSLHSDLALPHPWALGLTTRGVIADFQEAKLKLKNGAEGYALGEDWATPLTQVADAPPKQIAHLCMNLDGKKYFMTDKAVSFYEAQRIALQLQGRLLTISTPAEENYFLVQGRGLRFWMSGWRPPDRSLDWRDQRNKKLRFLGTWGPSQPDFWGNYQWQLCLWTDTGRVRGWHDVETGWRGMHACIEWGEEYP